MIELAIVCSSIVLPVRGGATIRPRWPLPIGVDQVHAPATDMSPRRLELEPLLRVERRQVVEEDLVAGDLRVLEVDRLDLDQREVALAFLRRADLAGDGVAGAQVEAADLRRRDVDVVRARQVVVLGRAQEAEAVRQALSTPSAKIRPALLGLRLQDLEDQLLLAHAGGALDAEVLGDLGELARCFISFSVRMSSVSVGLPFGRCRRRSAAGASRLGCFARRFRRAFGVVFGHGASSHSRLPAPVRSDFGAGSASELAIGSARAPRIPSPESRRDGDDRSVRPASSEPSVSRGSSRCSLRAAAPRVQLVDLGRPPPARRRPARAGTRYACDVERRRADLAVHQQRPPAPRQRRSQVAVDQLRPRPPLRPSPPWRSRNPGRSTK